MFFYQKDKELTFTPKISKKSREIEANLTQKFIKQHLVASKPKKEEKIEAKDKINRLIYQIKGLDGEDGEERIPTKYNTENERKQIGKQSDKSPDRVDIILKRHELFQNWLKEQRKLREKQVTEKLYYFLKLINCMDCQILESCTFQPNKRPGQRPLSPEDKEKTVQLF